MKNSSHTLHTCVCMIIILSFNSCWTKDITSAKILHPINGQAVNANQSVEVSGEIRETEITTLIKLIITKDNNTHDTIKNISFPNIEDKYDFTEHFLPESNTRYKIFLSALGSQLATDSIFVTCP